MEAAEILLAAVGAVVGHAALAAYCGWTRVNVLYALSGALLIVMPFSLAIAMPIPPTLFKVARLYLQLLIIVIGLLYYHVFLSGSISTAVWGWAAMYVLAAVYSSQPLGGLIFKGLFLLSLTSGMIVGAFAYQRDEFDRLVRVVAQAASVFALICLGFLATHPGSLWLGRATIWGINPNFLGQATAVFAIASTWALIYLSPRGWRLMVNLATLAGLGVVLLLAGSRGALGLTVIACGAALAPMMRRPGRFLGMALGVAVLVFVLDMLVLGSLSGAADVERLTEFSPENRFAVWGRAMEHWRHSPLIGIGFTDYAGGATSVFRRSQVNHHSMYVQVLVETGIVGFALFAAGGLYVAGRVISIGRRWLWRTGSLAGFLPIAGVLLAVAAHGLGESASLMGSNANSFLVGLVAAMLDRMARDLEFESAEVEDESEWMHDVALEPSAAG